MICSTCRHHEPDLGICILHTPEPDPEVGHGNWVEVKPNDTCSEWEVKANEETH